MAHDLDPGPAPIEHRDLGRELSIYATDPLIGSGLPLWRPAGAIIRHELEMLAADLARRDGCLRVYSPVLAKRALYERSGHWAKFSDDMFPPMPVGGDELVLRPVNCPHHALIYAADRHSYRELPIRLNELAPMFRAERSGVVSGLSRVRQINLDDTHVFCRPDQIAAEIGRGLRSALEAQRILGLRVDSVRLSRRGAGAAYLGSAERWLQAEDALRSAARDVLWALPRLDLVEAGGEAAFYGPKLDLQVRSGRDQEESIATVQLDVHQPEQFDLSFDGPDGARERVVMIHRGTVGSMERVVAALLERYRGRLPLWLAPVQVCVMPVGPDQDEPARAVLDDLLAAGLRARLDTAGSLGARIRSSRQRRDSVMAVLGPAEVSSGRLQVTDVAAGFSGSVARESLEPLLGRAYAGRQALVEWPAGNGAAAAP